MEDLVNLYEYFPSRLGVNSLGQVHIRIEKPILNKYCCRDPVSRKFLDLVQDSRSSLFTYHITKSSYQNSQVYHFYQFFYFDLIYLLRITIESSDCVRPLAPKSKGTFVMIKSGHNVCQKGVTP